jgi:hypothetical protein
MHLVAAQNGLHLVAAIVLAGCYFVRVTDCGDRVEQHRTLLYRVRARACVGRPVHRSVVALTRSLYLFVSNSGKLRHVRRDPSRFHHA